MIRQILLLTGLLLALGSCCGERKGATERTQEIVVGAADTASYFPLLAGKRVALLANHTARVGEEHLADLLHRSGVQLTAIFAPEHGFRGTADAGEAVAGGIDSATGVPIRSLYNGHTLRPSDEAMRSFDLLLVDMQDVGVRFYTYYIAMLRMMEAAADFQKEVVVLDRPNPHGNEVDGPILDMARHKSGVGALPIPVLHGLTMGEIARMAVGEGWCKPCRLEVIRCLHYTHSTLYTLPTAPSPNLASAEAVALYPSLCLFEGTILSVGRGTEAPFTCFGHPRLKGLEAYPFGFTPTSRPGAKEPLFENEMCFGRDLRGSIPPQGLSLEWLVEAYRALGGGNDFFKPIFEKLIGVDYVREMILAGASAEEIEACWQEEVEHFKELRRHYLLYKE